MKNDEKNYNYIDSSESYRTNLHQHREAVMEQEQGWFSTEDGVTEKDSEPWPIIRTDPTIPDFIDTTGDKMSFAERTGAGVLLKDSDGEITGFLILWEELFDDTNILKWVRFLIDQDWCGKDTIRDLIQLGIEYTNVRSQNPDY